MIDLSLCHAKPVAAGSVPPPDAADQLHVWRWEVGGAQDAWLAQLDPVEQQQHQRFVTPELSRRFLAAHGGLRQVLAGYLDCQPDELEFERAPKGKPFLPDRALEFNISHSGDEVVLVVGRQPVGIDIEFTRSITDLRRLAEKYFTDNELADLRGLPDDVALGYFLQIWTRKEAIVKLTGLGLGASVRLLDVASVSCDFCRIELPPQWETNLNIGWLADLTVANNCYGAIASQDRPIEVRCFALASCAG
ncbi:4'-phosphopantetheinyl transferase family protein [Aeoliella sp.]|uniref:4'-phosphopantetheinyl transferase family protein n=1 Tax=Aeoliella sp. TaxID=2795800 RepID=UPI003CCB9D1A